MSVPSLEDTPAAKRLFGVAALALLLVSCLMVVWIMIQYGSINKFLGLE